MGVVCDTMVAQRLIHPAGEAFARTVAGTPDQILVSPLSVEQQLYGWRRVGYEGRAQSVAARYAALFAEGTVELVELGHPAAAVAGRLRADQPVPPLPPARGRGQTKPERRVSWTYDVLIAASAWAGGHRLASLDGDLHWIAARLAELYPGEPLELVDPLPAALGAP